MMLTDIGVNALGQSFAKTFLLRKRQRFYLRLLDGGQLMKSLRDAGPNVMHSSGHVDVERDAVHHLLLERPSW